MKADEKLHKTITNKEENGMFNFALVLFGLHIPICSQVKYPLQFQIGNVTRIYRVSQNTS